MHFKNARMRSIRNSFMHKINVSIVYATVEQQWVYETSVARGTSAAELFELADFRQEIDLLADADPTSISMGVFAQKIEADYLLEDGDRVEIYRPLKADPKEVRRQLALLGKTIGKNKN